MQGSVRVRRIAFMATNPDATLAASYLELLEGEPDGVAGDYATVRAAATTGLAGEPISNADEVTHAAQNLDFYLVNTCPSVAETPSGN